MTDNSTNEHPGAQEKLKTKTLIKSPIIYLIVIASLLSLYSFLQANVELPEGSKLWNLELLDLKTSVTLLIATVSLFYTRNQFEYGYMPIIDYRISYPASTKLDFNADVTLSNVLACSLRNQNSIAVVTAIQYVIRSGDNPIECQDYSEVTRILESKLLKNKVHYSLLYISNGWSLGENDERIIFELSTDYRSTDTDVTGIDIKLEYRSLLGDYYVKNIYCIPRRGINV